MRWFTILALAVAIGLATAASPFASSSPDGLERVAEDKGFLERGHLGTVQDRAPVPDYAAPGHHRREGRDRRGRLRGDAARLRPGRGRRHARPPPEGWRRERARQLWDRRTILARRSTASPRARRSWGWPR